MKIRMTLLIASLLLSQQAMAKDVPVNVAQEMANTTTPTSISPSFDALEAQPLPALASCVVQRVNAFSWRTLAAGLARFTASRKSAKSV